MQGHVTGRRDRASALGAGDLVSRAREAHRRRQGVVVSSAFGVASVARDPVESGEPRLSLLARARMMPMTRAKAPTLAESVALGMEHSRRAGRLPVDRTAEREAESARVARAFGVTSKRPVVPQEGSSAEVGALGVGAALRATGTITQIGPKHEAAVLSMKELLPVPWPGSPLMPIVPAWPAADLSRSPLFADIQGVSHDAFRWFFSTTYALYDVPLFSDLDDPKPNHKTGVGAVQQFLGDPEYDHFNDFDVYDRRVYVPVNDRYTDTLPARTKAFEQRKRVVVAVLDAANLRLLTVLPVPDGPLGRMRRSAPWCAVNPRDGLLYTSEFGNQEEVDAFHRAPLIGLAHAKRVSFTSYAELAPEPGRPVPRDVRPRLDGVQGGAFSHNGHLYLAVDAARTTRSAPDEDGFVSVPGGIYGVDVETGAVRQYRRFRSRRQGDEAEGLSVWDLRRFSPYRHFGGAVPDRLGVVHLLSRRDRNASKTDFWHYDFADPADAERA